MARAHSTPANKNNRQQDRQTRTASSRISSEIAKATEITRGIACSSQDCLLPRWKIAASLPPADSAHLKPIRARPTRGVGPPMTSGTVLRAPSLSSLSTTSASSRSVSPLKSSTSASSASSPLKIPSQAHLSGVKGVRSMRRQAFQHRAEVPTPGSTSSPSASSKRNTPKMRIPEAVQTIQTIKTWKKGCQIGAGSFGAVFKAQDSDTGRIFAVKQAAMNANNKDDEKLLNEINICSTLRHPNIVSYLGCAQSEGYLCILLEYVPGGSMASVLCSFGTLTSNLLRQATQDTLEGLHHLHTQPVPIMHRDLKCANLLVDLEFRVKVADFGCSKQTTESKSFSTIGSIPWMAPEVLQGRNGYGRKADIWSLGCTSLEMATAEKPWGNGAFSNVMNAMRIIAMTEQLPEVPNFVPSWCQEFIHLCVCRDVETRPTTAKLLRSLAALLKD